MLYGDLIVVKKTNHFQLYPLTTRLYLLYACSTGLLELRTGKLLFTAFATPRFGLERIKNIGQGNFMRSATTRPKCRNRQVVAVTDRELILAKARKKY